MEGGGISYLAYTVLRPGSEDYHLSPGEDLRILRQAINELVVIRKRDNHISSLKVLLLNTLKFFE